MGFVVPKIPKPEKFSQKTLKIGIVGPVWVGISRDFWVKFGKKFQTFKILGSKFW
jgi:hypothetical protein